MSDSEEWLSAGETLKLAQDAMAFSEAHRSICKRCHDGLIRGRAKKFFKANKVFDNVDIPKEFWWASGGAALNQNWPTGDFDTWIDSHYHWRAYGVEFLKQDIMNFIPGSFGDPRSKNTEKSKKDNMGGRAMSKLWPDWVAELVSYIDENDIPDGERANGQDEVINAVETRLIGRGLQAPSRSTVQPTVRAVLLRIREARNG